MAVHVSRNLALALAISLGLHGVLVFTVRTQPATANAVVPPALQAWIERSERRPDPQDTAELATPSAAGESAQLPALPAPEPIALAKAAAAPVADPRKAGVPAGQPESGATIPLLRDPTYHPIAALDVPPKLLGQSDDCFPHGATGEVAYVLLIDDTGTVDQASIADVKPEGLFTAAAVEMCSRLKFEPAIKNGRAVRSRVRFVVGAGSPTR